MVGASREMVSRVMKDLSERGFISIESQVDHDHQPGAAAIAVTSRGSAQRPNPAPAAGDGRDPARGGMDPGSGAVGMATSRWCLRPTTRTDPGPAVRAATEAQVMNRGGVTGAWIADVLFFLFGFSAWWWVAFAALAILRLYRRVEAWKLVNPRSAAMMLCGFGVALAASCTLEALRMRGLVASGFEPGGVLGTVLAGLRTARLRLHRRHAAAARPGGRRREPVQRPVVAAARRAARRGARVGVRCGAQPHRGPARPRSGTHQGPGARGKGRGREEGVRGPRADPHRVAEVAIAKSERVAREKQKPLFADLPDSPLPPLDLLDAPETHVERPTAETLEFTSRLIEKKLKDFGVEVKVVAAYPGPVITRYEIEPAVGVKGAQIVEPREGPGALAVGGLDPRGRDDPGQDVHGARAAQSQARRSCACRRSSARRSTTTCTSQLTLALGKDIVGNPVVADLAQDAAPAGRRHHRLGQVGRHQRDDPVAALQGRRPRTCA